MKLDRRIIKFFFRFIYFYFRFLDENLTLEVNIEEVIPDEDFEDPKDTEDLKQDFTDDSYTSIYNKGYFIKINLKF